MATGQTTGPSTSEGGGAGLVVRIDHGMCSGTKNCERVYPEMFVVHDAKAWVRDDADWAQADTERLEAVESACPWAAIEVAVRRRPVGGEEGVTT